MRKTSLDYSITAADMKHLHDEIIVVINQRFLITTAAIATFAAIDGWLFQAIVLSTYTNQNLYLVPALLMLVLFGLFFVSHQLRNNLFMFATYLEVFNLSHWQHRYLKFRQIAKPAVNTKAQAGMFFLLGLISASLPFLQVFINHSAFVITWENWILIASFCIYAWLLFLLGFRGKWDLESHYRKVWKQIAKQNRLL